MLEIQKDALKAQESFYFSLRAKGFFAVVLRISLQRLFHVTVSKSDKADAPVNVNLSAFQLHSNLKNIVNI